MDCGGDCKPRHENFHFFVRKINYEHVFVINLKVTQLAEATPTLPFHSAFLSEHEKFLAGWSEVKVSFKFILGDKTLFILPEQTRILEHESLLFSNSPCRLPCFGN